ncbi:GNAT family N-acetyltransferase [Candidatus Oscillochloris fontis]|uniref:GNAT family N-acetyltransferase n=1 Tax=Candidatus Oscillochloris fontis TaxID=2496868 RepID=UPI00101D3A65|nr:GNAT family N-acetyltransferase [Candidatus Oscillochloris fontis]
MYSLRHLDIQTWWDVARQSVDSTFFHTPLWAEIALRTHPHLTNATQGFLLPNGVRAIFPLLTTRRLGPLQSLMSTFEYCYGGIITDGPISPHDLKELYKRTCSWNVTGLRFLENPIGMKLDLAPSFFAQVYETHMVPLDTNFETYFAQLPKDRRNAYRKGCREGVQVGVATSREAYQDYYRVYQDTVRRWGEDPEQYGYRWGIFDTIWELAQEYPDLIKLWVASLDGKIIAGSLTFYWNRHCVAWHGCAYTEYLRYKPYVMLDVEAVRDAIAHGYAYYDLNPTGDLRSSVATYKAHLGTQVYPVTNWQYQHLLLLRGRQMYRHLRQRIAS